MIQNVWRRGGGAGGVAMTTAAGSDSPLRRFFFRFFTIDSWSSTLPKSAQYAYYSKEKIFFQSFFMLTTVQPFFFASSYKACVNAPTLVAGRPVAGP